MKKNVQLLLSFIAIAICLTQNVKGQTLVHYWHFNNDTVSGDHLNNLVPDYSIVAGAMIVNQAVPGAGADTGYVDNFDPGDTTLNVRMGADTPGGIHEGIRLRNPNDSMECLIYMPTNGFENIVVKFATQKSSNGPASQMYDYSVDSGATWVTTGLDSTSFTFAQSNDWELVTLHLSSAADTMIKNNAKLVLRIKLGTPNTGTSGNNRFDNITVDGDSIVIPTSTAEVVSKQGQYSLYPNPAGSVITIAGQAEGMKTIAIYNISGQKVYITNCEDKNAHINIASLNAGIYYVTVTDDKGISSNKLKFVKN